MKVKIDSTFIHNISSNTLFKLYDILPHVRKYFKGIKNVIFINYNEFITGKTVLHGNTVGCYISGSLGFGVVTIYNNDRCYKIKGRKALPTIVVIEVKLPRTLRFGASK